MPAHTRPAARHAAADSTHPNPDTNGDGPAPLVALDPTGSPVVLRYDLPEPTSYRGRNVIDLNIPADWFVPPDDRRPLDDAEVHRRLLTARRTGVFDPDLFDVPTPIDDTERALMKDAVASSSYNMLFLYARMGRGIKLAIQQNNQGTADYGFVQGSNTPRLLLIERYRLSSFPTSYGAGRTLKTFSLLPGERTKIRLSTYKRSSQTRQQASSILDETSEETERDFEQSVQDEHSNQESTSSNLEYHAEAEGEAKWGWGSAKASGGVKGSTATAREEFTKNLTNAVGHNAARASARREVHVDTSLEVQTEDEKEEAVERELENINVSRTLNFVFRQMNQEYLTVLHLVDLRVAFFADTPASRDEVPLAELDDLLDRYIAEPAKRDEARALVTAELAAITDHRGEPVAAGLTSGSAQHDPTAAEFIQRVTLSDPGTETEATYLRVNPDYTSAVTTPDGRTIQVAGASMTTDTHVMRTDGIVVDAFLGQGEALDDYSTGLQHQSVRERRITNDLQELETERLRLANQILRDSDTDRAALYQRLFPRQQIINQIDHAAVNSPGAGNGHAILTSPTATRREEPS